MAAKEKEDEIVVLTGASGCIGFHALSLLIELDDKVKEIRCVDLKKPDTKFKRYIDIELNKRPSKTIKWFQGDIRDINLIEKVLKDADCVIHSAAKIEAWTYWEDQDSRDLHSINVEGTENLLRTCQRLGVYKFIHVSSFETYIGYDTIYYATENTLPENKSFLFGPSGSSKWEAEKIVKQYANNKLDYNQPNKPDQLYAVIIRFSTVYGEFDNHYVKQILKLTKFFNGKLQRFSNIWIRQQSIYARNAAWSLIKAKQQLDVDQSISGEEFHITDDSDIADPYDFVKPFVEARGMQVTNESYSFIPIWILLWLMFTFSRFIAQFDIFGLFTKKKSRYQDAIAKDQAQCAGQAQQNLKSIKLRWYHYAMPQTLWFMCNSSFLNRTKASLRLDYMPIVKPEEAYQRSLEWYRDDEL